jgi:hypothetical protein
MSIQFSDTTNKKGLVQFYEKEIGLEWGDISNDNDLLRGFSADANESMDEFWTIALKAAGWRMDDSNHTTKFPAIYKNIVSGTRAYDILNDADGNQALEIYAAFVLQSATGTIYERIHPVSQSKQDHDVDSFNNGLNQSGVPRRYDKIGMTVYLDDIPNYNATNGLKLLISREGSYFAYNATTKMPGVPGILHSWFYLKPALKYARIHGLDSYDKIEKACDKLEAQIKAHFGQRQKDVKPKRIMGSTRVPHE